jgi:hypothetical protein
MKSRTSDYPTCVLLVILMNNMWYSDKDFSSVMYLADADWACDESLTCTKWILSSNLTRSFHMTSSPNRTIHAECCWLATYWYNPTGQCYSAKLTSSLFGQMTVSIRLLYVWLVLTRDSFSRTLWTSKYFRPPTFLAPQSCGRITWVVETEMNLFLRKCIVTLCRIPRI